jgi:heptosyltransferase-2
MAEKILIRGVNWIGDAVMTMPAIRAIRRFYPDGVIHLLIKPYLKALFERYPFIDSIVSYDERFNSLSGKIKLFRMLSKEKYSKAFLLQNAFDAALIAYLAGIPERIGYSRDGRGLLLTSPVPYNNEDRRLHHIDYYLNLLRFYGINADNSTPWIYLSLEERLLAREKLSLLKRPILGINVGATFGSAKRWFPERFGEIATWFVRDVGGSIVFFGGQKEMEIVQEAEFFARRNLSNHDSLVLNLCGKTTLRDLISFIAECDLLLTNDSGPMHIGYAVGTPLISIFGSTDPDLTGYRQEGAVVFSSNVECSPCFKRECEKKDLLCMNEISSDDVYFKVKEMIPSKRAVFFDRDGTLCKDVDYLNNWKDLEVFSEIKNLMRLKEKGYLLIGVTNQSGISRGIVDEGFVRDLNNMFIDKYGFDGFYYCPHSPDEHCECRKPEPKMLLEARSRFKIDLRKSYVIGDKDADMLLARAVGAKGILVKTGKQKESIYADFVKNNLREAVDLILSDG